MALEPQPAELAVVERELGDILTWASALVIADNDMWLTACDRLRIGNALMKRIDETFARSIKASHDAHKAALAARDGLKERLSPACTVLRTKISAWQRGEDRRLAEERRIAEAAARKEAEERAMREAEALAAQGHTAAAEAVLDRPLDVQPVFVPSPPKAQGISTVKRWTFRIVDANAVPRQYMAVDEVAIGKVVRALGSAANIPGVEVYETESVRVT